MSNIHDRDFQLGYSGLEVDLNVLQLHTAFECNMDVRVRSVELDFAGQGLLFDIDMRAKSRKRRDEEDEEEDERGKKRGKQ